MASQSLICSGGDGHPLAKWLLIQEATEPFTILGVLLDKVCDFTSGPDCAH